MRYDVIIPNYVTERTLGIVRTCLGQLRECSPEHRLILVDNASPAWREVWPEVNRHQRPTVVRNPENLGFVKAVNQGLRLARAERIVLLNNDVWVSPGWMERMDAALRGQVGIVGPRSNQNGTISASLTYVAPTILPRGAMLPFFCVMLTREVVDRVGLLDEAFGVGLGDDDDYCHRAQRAGFDLCYLGDLTIRHFHKTTFQQLYTDQEVAAMTRRAEGILRERYGSGV